MRGNVGAVRVSQVLPLLDPGSSSRHRVRIGEATALENLGLTDLSLGRTEDAIGSFLQAQDIFAQSGVARGVMGMTRHIGEAHRDAGRFDQPIQHLTEAQRLATALPDPYNEARCLTGLGETYLKAGEPTRALGPLGEAAELMASLGGEYEQARISALLADALLILDQPEGAREHLTSALVIYAKSGAPEADDVRRKLDGLPAEPG